MHRWLSKLLSNFKKILVVFWSVWWLIALWTDIVGAMSHMGWLAADWAPDTNYPFLVSSLKMYSPPVWLTPILFIGIMSWSLISTLAFIYASVKVWTQGLKPAMRYIEIAFVVSLSYWLAFFIADQLIMKFDLEENHMVQGGFQLLTFLCFYCLPEQAVSE